MTKEKSIIQLYTTDIKNIFSVLLSFIPYIIFTITIATSITTNTTKQTQIILALMVCFLGIGILFIIKRYRCVEFNFENDTLIINDKQKNNTYQIDDIVSYNIYFLIFGKKSHFIRLKLHDKNLYYLPGGKDPIKTTKEDINDLTLLDKKLNRLLSKKKENIDNHILILSHSPFIVVFIGILFFIIILIAATTDNMQWFNFLK